MAGPGRSIDSVETSGVSRIWREREAHDPEREGKRIFRVCLFTSAVS